jgi:hypothetical protein
MFGMSFGVQIRMALALDTENAQTADRILVAYRKVEEAGRRGPKAREWGEITRSLRIERLSPGIQFSITDAGTPPEEMLAQLPAIPMLQPLKSSASIHAALAALDLSNAPESAPVSRKIVITGLDGSKEVPAH